MHLVTAFGLLAQCPASNVFLTNQAAVNSFAATYPTCTSISGYLYIGPAGGSSTDITDLTPLSNIESVGSYVWITKNQNLTSLEGLHNIETIGSYLDVTDNDGLTSLDGLDKVSSVTGSLDIYQNDGLISLEGLGQLQSVGANLNISSNANLLSLEGLDQLSQIGPGTNEVGYNPSLQSLDGLEQLQSITGNLRIWYNPDLTSIAGLNQLSSIGGFLFINANPALPSLTGLDQLQSIGNFIRISDNDMLTALPDFDLLGLVPSFFRVELNDNLSVCSSNWVCNNINNPSQTMIFSNNAPGCDTKPEVAASCGPAIEAICQNATAYLQANGQASISASDVDGGTVGAPSSSVSPSTFTCDNIGPNTVTLTVYDASANSSTCTATVTVLDNMPPVISCPADITIECDQSSVPAAGSGGPGIATATDNCADNPTITFYDVTAPGTCPQESVITRTWTATDASGYSNTCVQIITIVDSTPPAFDNVPGNTTVACDAIPAPASPTATDNCDAQVVITPNETSVPGVAPVVEVITRTWTATDDCGNSSTATQVITVVDNTPPSAICQNITVQLDASGAVAITTEDIDGGSTDACGIANISATPTSFDCEDTGSNDVVLTVNDVNGNTNTCTATVTVKDEVAPEITSCQGGTIDFNGEPTFLSATAIDFDATDVCGVASITYSPEYISCEQLGETVPVTITVTDNNGNSNSCMTSVVVTGLPCGFMDFGEDGIGCEDSNDASYDAPTDTYTLASEGCYSTNWTTDNAAYLKYDLCGNGEIIAHIASLNPLAGGWAGISARESEATGSKKVALATNLGNMLRREIRTMTNGYAYPQQFFRPGATWLKLTRNGNQFVGSASSNGINWQIVLVANVSMSSCIQFGLYATNTHAGTLTATFDNVTISGGMPNANLNTPETNLSNTSTKDFTVFPNPAKDEVRVDLSDYYGQQVQLQILNQLGQPLLQRQLKEVGSSPESFDVNQLNNGIYTIRLTTKQGDKVKRFLIVK